MHLETCCQRVQQHRGAHRAPRCHDRQTRQSSWRLILLSLLSSLLLLSLLLLLFLLLRLLGEMEDSVDMLCNTMATDNYVDEIWRNVQGRLDDHHDQLVDTSTATYEQRTSARPSWQGLGLAPLS